MPQRSRQALRWLAPAILLFVGATGATRAAVHLALVKSEPADSANISKSPKAIVLWFSQQPNVKLTRLVLTHERDTVKTGTPATVDTAGKQIRVIVAEPLGPGEYDVNWRTLARDGHAVLGKFSFTVKSGTISGSSSTAPPPR